MKTSLLLLTMSGIFLLVWWIVNQSVRTSTPYYIDKSSFNVNKGNCPGGAWSMNAISGLVFVRPYNQQPDWWVGAYPQITDFEIIDKSQKVLYRWRDSDKNSSIQELGDCDERDGCRIGFGLCVPNVATDELQQPGLKIKFTCHFLAFFNRKVIHDQTELEFYPSSAHHKL